MVRRVGLEAELLLLDPSTRDVVPAAHGRGRDQPGPARVVRTDASRDAPQPAARS